MSENEGKSPMIGEIHKRDSEQKKEKKKLSTVRKIATAAVAAVGLTIAADMVDKPTDEHLKRDESALGDARDRLQRLQEGNKLDAIENELTENPLAGYVDFEDWQQANPNAHPDEEKRAREYFESQAKK